MPARTGRGSRVRETTNRSSAPSATARTASTTRPRSSSPVPRADGFDGEHERLRGDEPDGDRAAPHDHNSEPERDEQPDQAAAHVSCTSHDATPSSAAIPPSGEQPRREQDPHLRDQRLGEREPRAEHDEHERENAELLPDAVGVRQEDLRREHEHEPVPGGRRPLQVGEVAAGVLEQRPFVDHRQLEMGVGVVDRLSPGLGDDDKRERDRGERRAPGSTRRPPPAVPAIIPLQVRRAGDERGDGEREHERRLVRRRRS